MSENANVNIERIEKIETGQPVWISHNDTLAASRAFLLFGLFYKLWHIV